MFRLPKSSYNRRELFLCPPQLPKMCGDDRTDELRDLPHILPRTKDPEIIYTSSEVTWEERASKKLSKFKNTLSKRSLWLEFPLIAK
ncbi:hypothetical protein TNCV_2981591 [Trichonephila clavipes]|nr:hypothetical protein TNCV_2981591 [Trichonephila clavipes]